MAEGLLYTTENSDERQIHAAYIRRKEFV